MPRTSPGRRTWTAPPELAVPSELAGGALYEGDVTSPVDALTSPAEALTLDGALSEGAPDTTTPPAEATSCEDGDGAAASEGDGAAGVGGAVGTSTGRPPNQT